MNEQTLEQLSAPLNPGLISIMKAGPAAGAPYLEGHIVIEEANLIFGYGQWGFVLDGPPFVLAKGSEGNGKGDVWAATGRITVAGGESHADMGTNTQSGPGSAAVEMASKGCITDCIKRCLSHYGDRFGLILRDKEATAHDGAEIGRRWREYMTAQGGALPASPNEPPPLITQPTTKAPEYTWGSAFKAQMLDLKPVGVNLNVIRGIVGLAADTDLMVTLAKVDEWLAEHNGSLDLLFDQAKRAVQAAGARR